MDGKEKDTRYVELAQQALQANREHLDALKTHTQKLETDLEVLDKLIEVVDSVEESDLDVGSSVTIPGSVRATAPITVKELLSAEFPFHEDALKRSRYRAFSEVHPMKPKELEALADAVQAEGYRQHALDIQRRGPPAFPNIGTETTHALGLDLEGLDWDRIAEKVSIISGTRTAKECQIRWLGERHPELNHEPWREEEVLKVKSLAAGFTDGRPDWVEVAKRLGTKRTPLDCMRHATTRKLHQWTAGSDERLLKAIHMYGHENWHLVARYVSEDATPSQCSSRYEKTLDQSIRHTNWSAEEDARLSAAVAAYGSSWMDVAANILGRHNDQCRDRWNEQISPHISKNQWTEEEDKILLDCAREDENVSWKEISGHLPNGRTEATCRSRYTTLHKGGKAAPAMSVVNHEESALVDQASASTDSMTLSSSTFTFKPSFPKAYSCSTTLAPPHTESHPPREIVFLEPLVSSNPEYHRLRPQMATASNIRPLSTMTMPPKKRKTRSRVARSKKAAKEARLKESASQNLTS